jgi:signal transduction histidine kinase
MYKPTYQYPLLCFLLFCTYFLKGQNDTSIISSEQDFVDVPLYAEVYADSTLTIDSFIQNPTTYSFIPNVESKIFRPKGAVYWLRFQVQNKENNAKNRLIIVEKREIEDIQLHLVLNNHVDTFLQSGVDIPINKRPYPHCQFWFPITIKPFSTYTVYLRLDSRYDILSTKILFQSEHLEEMMVKERKNAVIIGICVFYFLLALVMLVYMRQALFFYYCLYVGSGLGYLISSTGFGLTMFWHNFTRFDAISDSLFAYLSIMGFIFLSRQFLNTRLEYKKLDIILKIGIAFAFGIFIVTIFKKAMPLFFSWICDVGGISLIVTLSTIFYVCIAALKQTKRREIGLFFFSFCCYMLMNFLYLAAEFGLIKNLSPGFQTFYNVLPQIFLFIEMTVLSMILIRRIRQELTDQQVKTIESQLKVIHQRERISRDLHDDVGSTLTSISIYSELAKRQMQDKNPQSVLILENIGTTARQLSESINDIVWSINPDNDQFTNITQRMRMFVAQLVMAQNVTLHFEDDVRLNEVILSIEKRKNFYLLFKEAINNIVKYANCKTLKIKILQQNGNIELIIHDDGCGFDCPNAKNGNGMKTMRHRAKELNGVLVINSEVGYGTILNLRFPVQ